MVAIIIPQYKEELTDEENISMKHLRHFLGKYDKYFIVPNDLNIKISHNDFFIKRFNKKYFRSEQTYNKLMLTKSFYETFDNYEYILIYQLDSLVFSDQLLQWCKQGYDYIGAPWFITEVKKYVNWKIQRDMVGNGGFSLRKTSAFINILNMKKNPTNIFRYQLSLFIAFLKHPKITILKSSYSAIKNYIKFGNIYNEDIFWGIHAPQIYPAFKVPSPEIAVAFAFEVGPKFCFKKNQNTLPFGCHAWSKYDRNFWEPYLLK